MKFSKTWVELRGSSTKEIQFVEKKNTIIAIDINLERGNKVLLGIHLFLLLLLVFFPSEKYLVGSVGFS
jgi:hypothetical protein